MAENQVPVGVPKRSMNDVARPQSASGQLSTKQNSRKFKKMDKKRALIVLTIVVVLGILVFFINSYQSQKREIKRLSNPQAIAQQEQQQLVAAVGKLVELPKNENPTVATVSDVSKLKDQAFFANAQNGDKVLIYSQSKQAILYRPSTNKVIQISSVNLGEK